MASSVFLSSLNLGTLVVGLLIIGGALFLFLRKRSNRHSMDGKRERNVAADLDKGRGADDRSPPA
jgi:LPXTG-motif cell wall-anchored protein